MNGIPVYLFQLRQDNFKLILVDLCVGQLRHFLLNGAGGMVGVVKG